MIKVHYDNSAGGSWYLVRDGIFIGQFSSRAKAMNYLRDLVNWKLKNEY